MRPVDRAPVIRLLRTIASSICGCDCDAYHNFHVLKEGDMLACLEDIKVPCPPITFTETDPRAAQ